MKNLELETAVAQQDWNDRARKNALHYICSERKDWDLESFFKSGEADYDSLAAPFLSKLGFATEAMSMIEVGCGVGRVTRSFARRFASVTALDVSEEMLGRGRGLHKDFHNIVWTKGDGKTFSGVESRSMHFAFSYLVLQHIPSKELVLGYVREMMRVLKPGGAFCFQFNSCTYPTMNWKGRLLWRLVDESVEADRSSWVRNGGRKIASVIGVDGLAAGRTWRGAVLDPREVLETVWESGGLVHRIRDWGAPRTWCLGIKDEL